VTSNFHVFDGKFDSESLEIDNNKEDQDSCEQVVDVGERASVESLLDSS